MKAKQQQEPAQAGFFNIWDNLREYLAEVHDEELGTNHGGDARHSGPAPEVCSYCEVIRDAEQLSSLAANAPPAKQIECRGRNGYFWLAEVGVYNTLGTVNGNRDVPIVNIGFSSKASYRDAPPVMVQGPHDAIEQLLLHLLLEVGRQKDKLTQQQGGFTHAS